MITTLSLALLTLAGDVDPALRFGRDVRPILAEHCFECHGPDAAQRRGDLRLDLPSSLTSTRSSGLELLVPGDPARSELARRITAADEGERMPPADFRHALDAAERATLLRWIEEGGAWEEHWAYAPVSAPVASASSGRPIDAYLAVAWRDAGVEPSPPADARTAARRLALDLTGLPPEPARVEAFLAEEADDPDAAWTAFVDELLASPHHAERLAVFWLDLVRYADTVGYHGDQRWSVWPYRDWVIRSFAENLPFDAFTRAQVAGDLLPDATLEDRVAATYGRLNMVTFEGGSQPKEYLLKYQADRVRNLSMTWLGSTMGCAECHDHKFDPTTTRDFYSLAAFFADIEEKGVYTRFQEGAVPPELVVPSASDEEELARYDRELARVESELAAATADLDDERDAWEVAIRRERAAGPADLAWVVDEPPAGATVEGAWNWLEPDGADGPPAREQAGTGIVQHFFHGAPEPLALQEGDRFYLHVRVDPADPPRTIMLQVHGPDWDHRAYWGEDRISFGGIGADGPAHRRLGDLPAAGGWARLEVDPAQIGLGPGSVVDGFAFTQFGGRARWGEAGVRTESATLVRTGASPEVAAALASAARTAEEDDLVRAFFVDHAPSLAPLRAERERLAAERAAFEAGLPRTLAVVARAPRETRIRPRGNWMDDSGPVVEPGVPHFLPGLPSLDRRATRLDLANWLVAPENPLTARVLVNRVWRLFFGEGLARSVDDFGLQGEAPDHPGLLDLLARDFVASGWDVRALVRRIVTSDAYRASSDPRPELVARDPENRLFARQARRRLDAEFVRDVALAASGLLEPAVGGPSVKPYQPAGYWAQLNFPRRTWTHDEGPDLYRRGLYTFWCRTYLHPTLKAFDAPAREECTARRPRSNTPLQALALLGDPAFVEAARVLAERIVAGAHADDRARLDDVFARVLGRPAAAAEEAILLELLASQRGHFREHEESARALASAGEAPAAALDAVEVASWTAVARAVLNRGEAITRR